MTAAKRQILASMALIALGAGAAYYGVMMGLQGGPGPHGGPRYLLLGLVAALTAFAVTLFWRGFLRASTTLADRLDAMARCGQIEPIAAADVRELDQISRPLNRLLDGAKSQLSSLHLENRKLELQSRIAAAEKHHTEAIIFSISDAVIVTNRFDELILANQAAEKLLGFRQSAALRKNVDQVISDAALVRLIRETRGQQRNLTRKVVEHTIDHKGSPRTFSITLSCVAGTAEEVSGVVAVLHDVTREKEIAKIKTDFVSNVSHELKTPLASIKAYLEMLMDGEAEDEKTRREFYDIISFETERLHRLIENILNISRIESGVVKVVREPMSLSSVVKQALDVAAPQAGMKTIELAEQLAPVYHQVEADRDMIYQAVLNLISNAIKYTPEGGKITVSATVDEGRQIAICQVADTGMGIPVDDLPHIFDKFYRVRANQRMAKGTGLGLTLVKHIVETVHDGKLSVTSEESKGSTFSFELPIVT